MATERPILDFDPLRFYWDSGISLTDSKQLLLQRDLRFTTTRTDSLASRRGSLYLARANDQEATPQPLLLDGFAASTESLTSLKILSNDAMVNWLTTEGRAIGATFGSQTFIAGHYVPLIPTSDSAITQIQAIGNTVEIRTSEGIEYRLNAQGSGILRATQATAR